MACRGLPNGLAGLRVAVAATLGYARNLRHSDEAIIDFDQSSSRNFPSSGNLQTCPGDSGVSHARVPYATTFAGLYKRASGKEPFRLPARWIKAKSALDLNTPFDFVTTADTHGGNSRRPTVDEKGEIIGILFDGNREGLENRYLYTEEHARSVHVASNAILEALKEGLSRRLAAPRNPGRF